MLVRLALSFSPAPINESTLVSGSSSRDNDHRSSQFSDDYLSHHHGGSSAVDLTPSDKPSKSSSSSQARYVSSVDQLTSKMLNFDSPSLEFVRRAQLLSAVQQMVVDGSKSLSKMKSHHIEPSAQDHKIADFLRANLENLEGLGITSSNKVRRRDKTDKSGEHSAEWSTESGLICFSLQDLLALHNGAWGAHESESKRLSSSSEGEHGSRLDGWTDRQTQETNSFLILLQSARKK